MKQKLIGLTATAVVSSSLFASMAAADSVKVKSGDSLWKLSRDYQTTVSALKDANNLKTDLLRIGQVLEIPTKNNSDSKATAPQKVSVSTTTKEAIYTVKSGDSLSVIGRNYKLTVNELKQLNGLKTDLILVGQKLKVKNQAEEKVVEQAPTETAKAPNQQPSGSKNTSYQVRPGDSLWKIANKYSLTVAEIKVKNELKSDIIYVGQKLILSGELVPSKTTPVEQTTSNVKLDKMISEAKALIGTPYRWAGNTPSGFDCSGFIYYVLNKVTSVSRLSTAGYWDIMKPVSAPSVGDFVYFTTYKEGPSHMGIYLGNNEFIHTSSSQGVSISNLNNSYWKPRYLGAKRFSN
ncbi:LysM peptidoglycan-binding domain-containing protein [Metabacillus herbersteinensis]|uniref:LysM peptidoglycan-binding domain-containing protein n=1 Tax=Metabacillus herbersteinensis TaxID=283816 RepID=A0ABV6GMI3_9BACI